MEDETNWKDTLHKKKLKRFVVDIPIETKNKIKSFAGQSGKTIQIVVKDAFEFYLFAKEQQQKGMKK